MKKIFDGESFCSSLVNFGVIFQFFYFGFCVSFFQVWVNVKGVGCFDRFCFNKE